jgi:hypothetical protein
LRRGTEPHKHAVFWLAQAAGKALALDSIALDDKGDREIRKQAVFALPRSFESPALIPIVN